MKHPFGQIRNAGEFCYCGRLKSGQRRRFMRIITRKIGVPSGCLSACIMFQLLFCGSVVSYGRDFTWRGTEDSQWDNPNNWEDSAVPVLDGEHGYTNGLVVANGDGYPLIFAGAEETAWVDRFVVQNGEFIFNGGVMVLTNTARTVSSVGNYNSGGKLTVNGGRMVFALWDTLYVSENGELPCELTVNGGQIDFFRYSMRGGNRGAVVTVNLNGGVMQVQQPTPMGNGVNVFNFNGGVLRAAGSWPYSTNSMANYAFNANPARVCSGGAVVDVAASGFSAYFQCGLEHCTGDGENEVDGGLRKLGDGTLVLMGKNTYTGPTVIEKGTVRFADGSEILFTLRDGAGVSNWICGEGCAVFGGSFVIDAARAAGSGMWKLFDADSLDASFDAETFAAVFTDGRVFRCAEDGTYSCAEWTLDPQTGILEKALLSTVIVFR